VPEGGNYDGDVGSMGAIEVAQTLAENKVALRHPLEVIIFQNEEGGTIGSHAIAAGLTEKELNLVTNSRKTIREGIKFIGGDPDKVAGVARKPGDIAAYLNCTSSRAASSIPRRSRSAWSKASSASTGGT
jgi:N-carbamoyl-L-amino-acid hydrolase